MALGQSLKICDSSEVFVEKDGDWGFHFTKLILREGDDYFYTTIFERLSPSSIDLSRLHKTAIPTCDIWPPFEPGWSQAPDPLPPGSFLKQPSLLQYGDTKASSNMSTQLLKEARMCEVLKKPPHPNVATYLGCVVEGNRIKGLGFVKYVATLSRWLRITKPFDKDRCLRRIEDGICHLHTLGLIHNDINPSNIMVDDADNPVIIDFDSCQLEGSELGPKTCRIAFWMPLGILC